VWDWGVVGFAIPPGGGFSNLRLRSPPGSFGKEKGETVGAPGTGFVISLENMQAARINAAFHR
jgi:hypothetical protein